MITHKFYDKLPAEAVQIRTQVFIQEQGFEQEFDAIDDIAVHLVVFSSGQPAATGRMFEQNGQYMIGRVAVLPQFRRQKLGAEVLRLLELRVLQQGGRTIAVSAQCRAKTFYEKCGYCAIGNMYLDEGCPHIKMIKKIKE